MNSKIIKSKIVDGQIILYRRVSTKNQPENGYPYQLKRIKLKYSKFIVARAAIENVTEDISGCADAEIRMASGLGKCLRCLKRNPHAILLVSSADRIARRADIFVLIQKQGLGQRIYDVSTGLCLDDIVRAGGHHVIEKQTESDRTSRQLGLKRYHATGGVMGSIDIGMRSRDASQKKKRLADDREAAVLSVVSRLTSRGRGQRLSLGKICDELDHREIRTGQGRFFTPQRLSQFGKGRPHRWRHALDSYARPRRRIRQIITATQIEIRHRRVRQTTMRRLLKRTPVRHIQTSRGFDTWTCIGHFPHGQARYTSKCDCRDGCRGPPVRYDHYFSSRCDTFSPPLRSAINCNVRLNTFEHPSDEFRSIVVSHSAGKDV
ncbi:hypothetical protein GGR95_000029 [Sulfitobacter undariae]|uniref:Resolvase/invertase-type recombinase catalytic domain-containing protein n=1 Tax=Sulfitobacter undariae TaxID=1563671 RepID=A0A7W6E0D0_9RHOB|nr:recombinase family protein [Sulfitobacter undariae]MBB3992410.1 hypothetical protein [Sulfitobacter undariae]